MNTPKKIKIPQADPSASYRAHKPDIDAALQRVLASGRYMLGNEVEAFETEFAAYIGTTHSVGVANGTDAIELALRACGIEKNDPVYTVSHTAVATVAAIDRCGARPVLVDIDPSSFTMDPERLVHAILTNGNSERGAVLPVHLYGRPADMPAICEIADRFTLKVVEDCAQSHGAAIRGQKTGTWGDAAAFSFYPTKNLGALGDGGAVATNSTDVANRVRKLRQYGWGQRAVSEEPGINSRLDELQAAVLRVKLANLDADNSARIEIANQYYRHLHQCLKVLPQCPEGTTHVYHQYVIRSGNRKELQAYLDKAGIGTSIHYPKPVHLQPAYNSRYARKNLVKSEIAANEVLSLPIYPELSEDAVFKVALAILSFINK